MFFLPVGVTAVVEAWGWGLWPEGLWGCARVTPGRAGVVWVSAAAMAPDPRECSVSLSQQQPHHICQRDTGMGLPWEPGLSPGLCWDWRGCGLVLLGPGAGLQMRDNSCAAVSPAPVPCSSSAAGKPL